MTATSTNLKDSKDNARPVPVALDRVLWAAALLVVGAAQLAGAWAGWIPFAVLIVTAVVPMALVVLAARFGVGTGRTVLVLAVVLLGGAYLATRGINAGPVAALRDAVPRLLTGTRPAPATPDALAPGAVAAAVAGLWTGVRIVRPRPALLTPPVAAALLYTCGALLTAGEADRHGLGAGGLLLMTMVGWLLLGRPRHGAVPAGPGLAAAAGCAGVALLAGLLPVTGAFDPRQLVTPPSFTVAEPNPLPRLASWATGGDVELLRMRGTPQRLRLVTLSEYTGSSWRAAGIYRPLGTVDGPALPPGQRRTTVDVEVSIAGLTGPWLPMGGEPDTVSLHEIAVDPDSGSTVVRDGVRTGLRYRMRGDLDAAATPEELAGARVLGAGGAADRYLSTPGLPSHLADYARLVTRKASTPYEQAVAIEYAVKSGRTLDPAAPTGSSYARLTTFLVGTGAEAGAQVGTSEQFATAFAVLARSMALPTRIVVGFNQGEQGDDGMTVVRGRNAVAWPEVYFTGWGWQPFDPSPGRATVTGSADEAAKLAVLSRMAQRAEAPVRSTELAPPSTRRAAPTPATVAAATPAGDTWTAGMFMILGAVLLVPVLLLACARGVRWARHRRAGPLGAWSEVLDLLVLLGGPAPRSQPAPETAAAIAARLPGRARDGMPHPAMWLAEAADRARFGPGPHRADPRVWSALRHLRRAARRATPWYRRLLWPVDPRPLRRR